MLDICNLCHGAGNFFVCQEMPEFTKHHRWFHWFGCPNCNGVGTVRVYSSPTIKMRPIKGLKDQFGASIASKLKKVEQWLNRDKRFVK